MTAPAATVTVIIPTTAAPERAHAIERAIASVVAQEGVSTRVVVVVNGRAPDPALLVALGRQPGLRVLRREPAGLPAAIRLGRAAVDTPYFTELDDDDQLLPGALAARVACLEASPDIDVVVTNGLRRSGQGDVPHLPDFAAVRPDPLAALLRGNWLLPGAWLARADRFGPEFFGAMPAHLECTYLALRFGLTGRLTFLDEPTVAWTVNGGMSRTVEFMLGQPAGLERLLQLPVPPPIRAGLKRHLAAAHHRVSEYHRGEGRFRDAWKAHLASLGLASGWRFLPATRHLIRDHLRSALHAR